MKEEGQGERHYAIYIYILHIHKNAIYYLLVYRGHDVVGFSDTINFGKF